MRVQLQSTFDNIISFENLLSAWQAFVPGKRRKKDVQEFGFCLADNLMTLHSDLATFAYRHGGYRAFSIADPKPRRIHKASVRDRVLHHALYRVLYPFFDRTFIATSFSCREHKGTHIALACFRKVARRVSRNHTRTCWVLKMDITKFFASIDHAVLSSVLAQYIPDRRILWLLNQVIESFSSARCGVGLPLGNLTSQLLANVYFNEFDQFVKHQLQGKHFIRYADDFVLLSENCFCLEGQIEPMETFLRERLRLSLHPRKISVRTVASGVDFLGWVHFPHHRVLRTATKRRMFRRVREHPAAATVQSYLGLLRYGNAWKIRAELLRAHWLWGRADTHDA